MVILVTCKNEEDPIKNKGTREVIRLFIIFLKHSRAANSVASGGILTKFKLLQAAMVVLLPVRMKKIHPKKKALEWS